MSTIVESANIQKYFQDAFFLDPLKGSDRFIQISTIAGKQITGQIDYLNTFDLTIRSFACCCIKVNRKQKATFIPVNTITSITVLDMSYFPKFAYIFKQAKERWFIEAITHRKNQKKIIGELIEAADEYVTAYNDYLNPISFKIANDPGDPCLSTKVSIEELISIRKLPFSKDAIPTYAQYQLITNTLGGTLPSELISLVLKYLSEVPGLPMTCYKFIFKDRHPSRKFAVLNLSNNSL